MSVFLHTDQAFSTARRRCMSSSRCIKRKPWFFSNSDSSWETCCMISWLDRAEITHSVYETAAKCVTSAGQLYPPVIPHFDQPGLFLDTQAGKKTNRAHVKWDDPKRSRHQTSDPPLRWRHLEACWSGLRDWVPPGQDRLCSPRVQPPVWVSAPGTAACWTDEGLDGLIQVYNLRTVYRVDIYFKKK